LQGTSNDPKLWMDEGIEKRDISTEFKKIVDNLRRERFFSTHIHGRGGNKRSLSNG